jgi:predicted AAA+ superfamily ATPase
MCSTVLSALRTPYDALAENTRRHCAGLPAHHAVICGPPEGGKSWMLWEGTLLAGKRSAQCNCVMQQQAG